MTGSEGTLQGGADQAALVRTLDDEGVLPHILGAQLHRNVPCNTGGPLFRTTVVIFRLLS